jgi:hypothetical protein
MYGWSDEIVRTAVESVPEEILENEKVRGALEYLGSWIDQYSDYIEPHGDYYNDIVAEAERDGAVAVVERYQSMLADALHRQKMFGEEFDLQGFIDRLSTITVVEVLEGAR